MDNSGQAISRLMSAHEILGCGEGPRPARCCMYKLRHHVQPGGRWESRPGIGSRATSRYRRRQPTPTVPSMARGNI